jgi:hypothetical protein
MELLLLLLLLYEQFNINKQIMSNTYNFFN